MQMIVNSLLERLEKPASSIYAGLADRLRAALNDPHESTPEELQQRIVDLEKRGDKLALRIARALQQP